MTRNHRISVRLAAGLLLASSAVVPPATAVVQDATVKELYGARGPHEIVEDHVIDAEGADSILFRPADPDQGPYPVIVWGNGSDAAPAEYQELLEHFASWGFVVIATTNEQVGTGEEMMASLDHVEVMAADPTSPLFGAVDLERVGVTGHSQGAGGSAMAAERDPRLDAVATVALPQEPFAFEPEKQYDVDNIHLPILLFGGSLDPISPNTTNRDYFDRVQGPAATAMLTAASHNDVQGDGAAFRPYLTAWFRYLLTDDAEAAAAFLGDAPELAEDLDFNSAMFKDLPEPGTRASEPPRVPAPAPAEPGGTTPSPSSPPGPATAPHRPIVVTTATPGEAVGLPAPEVAAGVTSPGELARPQGPSADLALPAATEAVGDVVDLPALVVVLLVLGAAIQGLVPRRGGRSVA